MTNGDLTSLGSAGLLAFMLVKEVLAFAKSKQGGGTNGHSGQMPVSFWREQFRDIIRETLETEFKGRDETIRRIIREEMGRQ